MKQILVDLRINMIMQEDKNSLMTRHIYFYFFSFLLLLFTELRPN